MEERIESVFVYYLVMANLGEESIRGTDVAPGNPVRIEVKGTRTLDISVEAATRDVINVQVKAVEHHKSSTTEALVTFDFLDHQDGALFRVLTTSKPDDLLLEGDIVGMPAGLHAASPVDKARMRLFERLGVVASVLLFATAIGITPFIYRWTTGDWEYVWVLLLPLVAIILPLLIISMVEAKLWPKPRFRFPVSLAPTRYGGPFVPWEAGGDAMGIMIGPGGRVLRVYGHPPRSGDDESDNDASTSPTESGEA